MADGLGTQGGPPIPLTILCCVGHRFCRKVALASNFQFRRFPGIPATNERQVASRGAAGAPSEPQIDAYHGLRRVGECPS